MTGAPPVIPRVRFTDATGKPLALGTLTTYLAGTVTPAPTYQDQALTIPNINPTPLNANGEATVWLDPTRRYKFLAKDPLGVTMPGWPVDNIAGAATEQPTGSLNVKLFGAVGDGVADDTAAIQACLDSIPTGGYNSQCVYFPAGQYRITAGLTAVGKHITMRGDGPRSSLLAVAAGITAVAFNATGCPVACVGMWDMGIQESGSQVAMVAITVRNAGDFFLHNVFIVTSGKALDVGSSAGDVVFTRLSMLHIECYGGQEAIRFRCGGGKWTNIDCRKFRVAGVTGPAIWITGQVTSLCVSNSSFGGKGTVRQRPITSITDNGASFTVVAPTNGFDAGENFVIRNTGTAYDNQTWKVATTPNVNTVTVTATTGFGNVTPANATIDKLHATLYMDNSTGPVNETIWSNVLFEGIDDGGSAGGTGSVSLYMDCHPGTASIAAHQFTGCLFDAGQIGAALVGKNMTGGNYGISDIRFTGAVFRYVRNAFYMKEVRGVSISDASGDCIRSQAVPAELLNSAFAWIDGVGFQSPIGISIAVSTLGRQVGYGPNAIASFSSDYGLRIGGTPQDIKLSTSHIFGLTAPVLIDGGGNLPTDTRLQDTGCTYASGVGGETSATRVPTIASAATITLPVGGDVFSVSGAVSVSTIAGGWVGRRVDILATGALPLATGGNIARASTLSAGQMVSLRFGADAVWHY